jgi:hypothetical protein
MGKFALRLSQVAADLCIFAALWLIESDFREMENPDVSVFTDGKVEIMFKLNYEQAENLARLMKGQDL